MRIARYLVVAILSMELHAAAQVVPGSPRSPAITRVTERLITIELGEAYVTVAPVFIVPVTVEPGTRIRIKAMEPADKFGPVQWTKDLKRLQVSQGTLEIPVATSNDSGSYRARVTGTDGQQLETDQVSIFVLRRPGQQMKNVSAMLQISTLQPKFVSGFVVEPGLWSTRLLVRAVGPALTQFGVIDALTDPRLRINDSRGVQVGNALFGDPEGAARQVGAFPLQNGDSAMVVEVPAGTYTIEVSSAGGGVGIALLEVYQLPL